jgi:hypothetical protein
MRRQNLSWKFQPYSFVEIDKIAVPPTNIKLFLAR